MSALFVACPLGLNENKLVSLMTGFTKHHLNVYSFKPHPVSCGRFLLSSQF